MTALSYALLVGLLMASGAYLILQKSLVRVVIGVSIISNAVNLVLFSAGKFSDAPAPIIDATKNTMEGRFADPLPQALILTAIVIGFGVIAFLLVLCKQAFFNLNTDNVDDMRSTEP